LHFQVAEDKRKQEAFSLLFLKAHASYNMHQGLLRLRFCFDCSFWYY